MALIASAGRGGQQSQAFDLAADPSEARNLFGSAEPLPKQLQDVLQAYLRAMPPEARDVTSVTFDDETVKELKALGYF